jgi:hypothetical protein
MAFEHEVDKLRETLKSTEQRRATAEHDRGVWQRKAEHAETSLRDTKILVNEARDQRDHESVLCKQAEAQSVGWRTRSEHAETSIKTQHAEIEDLTEKLKRASLASLAGHALRDMTAMREHWKNRADGAEAGLVKMKAAYQDLMTKLAEKVQTILRADPESELIRGGQRAAGQIAQHVGLIIRPKIVAPVMVTWNAPDTTNT